MSDFPLARILDFVRTVPPFEALSPEELQRLVNQMDIAYFPPGQVVVQQNGAPASHLHIIHSGSVRITTREKSGQEILIDIRGEGDTFGASSILRGTSEPFSATAQEDLLTFELPGDYFRDLVENHPGFQQHYMLAVNDRVRALSDIGQSMLYSMTGAEPLGELAVRMHTRVSELMSRDVLTCSADTTIAQAARAMTEYNAGSIVVVDAAGQPQGLVTDTDFRSRVLAAGLSPDLPVKKVMSWPLKSMPPHAVAYEAVLEMTRHGIHHLVVTEGKRLVGLVSDHDISVITGNNPVGLVRRIDKVETLEELRRLPRRGYRALFILLRQGVSAELMLDLLSEFHDRLIEKTLELSEDQMEESGQGRAPADFAWMVFSHLGRREPVPPLFQQHMLVYSDVPRREQSRVQQWFLNFASVVSRTMEECGFPPSQRDDLATNPRWCNSLSYWRDTFRDWIRQPVPETLAEVGHVFDFRPVYQTAKLTEALHMAIFEEIKRNRRFLSIAGNMAVSRQPPLGFFRNFVVDKNGDYLESLDLRAHAYGPAVRAGRVFALEMHTTLTSTNQRLQLAANRGLLPEDLLADLTESFGLVALFRIARYLEARAKDSAPQNLVDPAELNKVQRNMFKKCFAANDRLREHMMKRYGS